MQLAESTPTEIFSQVESFIRSQGYHIVDKDHNRPWGGFFVLQEDQAAKFAAQFFPHLSLDAIQITQKLSPKFLVVAPSKRLSWQYHFRRAELWTVVNGPVGVAISPIDDQPEPGIYQEGECITLPIGQRHRLIGLANWGVVAEIWQHTDSEFPSDESDIVRLQDDFGR
ncbi:phosphoheptose isomerase [Aquirufa sp.]|jgi:mannose-6-phosphate isomerase-like protein (cupin superfamily)|uniref:phosphoheptose isomerase n=1 Tax=Aquirufa sp. TaxID=2676249 RepID=UPI0037BFD068